MQNSQRRGQHHDARSGCLWFLIHSDSSFFNVMTYPRKRIRCSSRMRKKSASVVLASLRGSTYDRGLAPVGPVPVPLHSRGQSPTGRATVPSLAAALLDGLFAHPAWQFSVVSNLDICNGYRGQNEFFRSLLGWDDDVATHNMHIPPAVRMVYVTCRLGIQLRIDRRVSTDRRGVGCRMVTLSSRVSRSHGGV
jgi:hypothetical protein